MKNKILFRSWHVEDLLSMAEMEKECFSDPWSYETLKEDFFKNEKAVYIIGELDGKLICYGGFWLILDEGHITNIAVRPQYRGAGIGEALVKELLSCGKNRGVKAFTLEVRISNLPAIGLYKKMGFYEAGVRPKYYGSGVLPAEDALIMWKDD